jgi:hypothetical protein
MIVSATQISLSISPMHDTWPPKLGRLNTETLLQQFAEASVLSDDNWDIVEVVLNEDFGIRVALPDQSYDPSTRALIKEVLTALPQLDDEVQRACLADQQKTKLPGRNFQNTLILVNLPDTDNIELSYIGTGMDTQWEETFSREGLAWHRTTPPRQHQPAPPTPKPIHRPPSKP